MNVIIQDYIFRSVYVRLFTMFLSSHRYMMLLVLMMGALHFSFYSAFGQQTFPDKLYPRTKNWSVNCRILRIAEKTVIVLFPGQEKPAEIQRTSLKKVEYENGRQVVFNEFGQIEGEISLSKPVQVKEVLSIGIVRLADDQEIVLNGIDYSLPADSLEFYYFNKGIEYVRSLLKNQTVQLQFDIQRRDEFGRLLAYVILPGGLILNATLIKEGYCRLDRGRMLMYLEDFKALEAEAQRAKRGIWKNKMMSSRTTIENSLNNLSERAFIFEPD